MANPSLEMAPLANTAEVDNVENRNANIELMNRNPGIDDGLRERYPNRPNYPEGNEDGYTPLPEGPSRPEIKPRKPLDVNLYATKKTVAQGMMDLALLTANSNQLRYVLESGNHSGPYYYVSIVLISLSILLQVVTGVVLIVLGRYNIQRDSHSQRANRLNNYIVLGIFLITVINVFISAFGIHPIETDPVKIVDATISSMRAENPEKFSHF